MILKVSNLLTISNLYVSYSHNEPALPCILSQYARHDRFYSILYMQAWVCSIRLQDPFLYSVRLHVKIYLKTNYQYSKMFTHALNEHYYMIVKDSVFESTLSHYPTKTWISFDITSFGLVAKNNRCHIFWPPGSLIWPNHESNPVTFVPLFVHNCFI